MKKMNSSLTKLLIFSLFLTIMLPVGVLAIVFGAINGIVAVWVSGIFFAAAGFYVMPVLWIKYGDKRKLRFMLSLIINENVYKVDELCAQTNRNRMDVVNCVNSLIQGEYLTGFIFVNSTELVLNKNKKQKKVSFVNSKCPNCGARMSLIDDVITCEYCGYKTEN